jgi:hypothetical protein
MDEEPGLGDQEPGLSDQYRKASPWPLFVALGFVLSELGILIGVFAVAVGGLLLFGGSVAGILNESGYVDGVWRSLLAFGFVLAALGGAVVAWGAGPDPGTLLAVVANPGGYGQAVPRALAVAVAGLILLTAGGTGRLLERSTAPGS